LCSSIRISSSERSLYFVSILWRILFSLEESSLFALHRKLFSSSTLHIFECISFIFYAHTSSMCLISPRDKSISPILVCTFPYLVKQRLTFDYISCNLRLMRLIFSFKLIILDSQKEHLPVAPLSSTNTLDRYCFFIKL
jgi:hypothetical protein